jgi:hypothetical protein
MPAENLGKTHSWETWSVRDFLILAFLVLFTVQCVRSEFFVNESGVDWRSYAAGTAAMPYQGRVGMMPWLRWSENNGLMVRGASKYQSIEIVGSHYSEPVTVEKFAALLTGLLSAFVLLGYCVFYARRKGLRPWWLPSVLLLAIMTISLSVRSEHNVWTPYDLPHTALFGIAVMCAFEGEWLLMLLMFALDVPIRETSIFLLAVAAPLTHIHWRSKRFAYVRAGALAAGMTAYWAAWRLAIHHRFAHNLNDTGPQFHGNLHEVLFVHHWPQMLCAGGYLIVFIWLERRRLSSKERLLLYCTLACAPVTAYFGVWGETRIWLEWSLPWAMLAASELRQYLFSVPIEFTREPGRSRFEAGLAVQSMRGISRRAS